MTGHGPDNAAVLHFPPVHAWLIPRRTRRTEVRVTAGLRRMLTDATTDDSRETLSIDAADVATIRAALYAGASYRTREMALLVLAGKHDDWTGTPQGRREMKAFLGFIAPACTPELWAEIVGDLAASNDSDYNLEARTAAEANLFANLADALAPTGPRAA